RAVRRAGGTAVAGPDHVVQPAPPRLARGGPGRRTRRTGRHAPRPTVTTRIRARGGARRQRVDRWDVHHRVRARRGVDRGPPRSAVAVGRLRGPRTVPAGRGTGRTGTPPARRPGQPGAARRRG